MNKIILDKNTSSYTIAILNEDNNKLVNILGFTKYKKDAQRIVKLISNVFNIDLINNKTDTTKFSQIIETIENESDIIMRANKQLFPDIDTIIKNKALYSSLVLTVKEGEKNFKKYVLDGTLNINNLVNKEQIMFLCNW